MINLLNKISHLARPGKTTSLTNEAGTIQTAQAKHSPFETSNVNSMQLVGLASAMPLGTDVMRLNIGGDNSNGTIIASNHQAHRPKNLATGETMIYDCAATQQSIYLKSDGTIVVTTSVGIVMIAPANVTINSPQVTVTGNLSVGTGATGTFTTSAGNTVTVTDGIVVNIS